MIRPIDLKRETKAMDVSGHYDWEKQTFQLDNCKFGTFQTTSISTGSLAFGTGDTSSDSYTD